METTSKILAAVMHEGALGAAPAPARDNENSKLRWLLQDLFASVLAEPMPECSAASPRRLVADEMSS